MIKKNLLPLACFTLFCVILYVVPIISENYDYWNNLHDFSSHISPKLYCEYIAVALGIMSVMIPIYIFSYKMDRRSVDMYFSLPITRRKIAIVNFFVGLLLMYAAYTIAYILGFITVAFKVKGLELVYYLYIYLALLIPAFILYSVTAFIFTRANTVTDGIISVIGISLLPALILLTCSETISLLSAENLWIDWSTFIPFYPFVDVVSRLSCAISSGKIDYWFSDPMISPTLKHQYTTDVCSLVGGIFWLAIAVAMTVGLFVSEKNHKAENCGQISESLFCYKLQIPIYTVVFILDSFISGVQQFVICLILFAAFVMSMIYKRSIKIGKKYAITLGACVLGAVIFGLVVIGI